MSTRTYTLSFSGAGTGVLPAGVFFYVKSASSALTIRTRGSTSAPIEFVDVGAGLKFGPVEPGKRWTYLDVTSAAAQTVVVIVSDDGEVDIASTVNVAGNVTVSEVPSSAIATPARVPVGAAEALLIAANASRRSLTIQLPTTATDSVNIGPSGGVAADRGLELQPGASITRPWNFAVYAFAVSGTQNVQVAEET